MGRIGEATITFGIAREILADGALPKPLTRTRANGTGPDGFDLF
jgi:hypothetical protein